MVKINDQEESEPADPTLLKHRQFLLTAADALEEEVRTSTPDKTKLYCQECCLEVVLEGCDENLCPYSTKR